MIATAAMTMLASVVMLSPPAHAESAQIRDLGVIPNSAVASYGSYMGELAEQGERIWMTVNGNPVTVAQVDPSDNSTDWQLPLPGTDGGSWAITASTDGTVYVGTWPDGQLYRKLPSENQFKSMGKLTDDATWIWSLTTGDDGKVYGGSYVDANTDGRVFSWTQEDGFHDYGVAKEGLAYVRSIAQADGVIYAGTGTSKAHVIAIDVESGEKSEIPIPVTPGSTVHALRVVDGNLYVHLGGQAIVYDLAAMEWNSVRSPGFGRAFSNAGPDGAVYADAGDAIAAINPTTSKATVVAQNPLGGYLLSMRWIERDGNPILLSMNKDGLIIEFDPADGSTSIVTPPVEGDIVQAQTLAVGPDNKVYVGGYMIGGLASFDIDADRFGDTHKPIPQTEGIATGPDGKLYLGTYAGAELYQYDVDKPWQIGSNPRRVLKLESQGQDRPFALAPVGDRMAMGTVPTYSKLGGALTIYDPVTDTARTWADLVTDQSIVSLVSDDGIIYGGTSVYGGLGVEPTQDDGVVFAFNPATGKKLWETKPVPGQRAVTGLMIGEDGAIYGMAGGTAFRTDPATQESRTIATIATVEWEKLDHYWADGYLNHNRATGQLTGSVRGVVFELDPATGDFETLATDTRWFTQDDEGRLYWTKGNHLFQAVFPKVPAPSPSVSASPPVTSPSPTSPPATTPSSSPSPSGKPTSTATPTPGKVDVYSTPGFHVVNGRRWYTQCEPYSQTIRCHTEIWSTQVHHSNGRYVAKTGWHFNNLTYLPFMTRGQWASNPLGRTGEFTSNARKWRTECDTPATGGNGCRSYIWSPNVVQAKQRPDGSWSYFQDDVWVFNNIVRFK